MLNFVLLLQESWNFIRNQRQFTLFAVGLLFALQLLSQVLQPIATPAVDAPFAWSANSLILQLIGAALGIIANLLIILNIKNINAGQLGSFFQSLAQALKAFFPLMLVTIIAVLPLSLALSSVLFAQLSGDTTLSLISLPLFVTGIFCYIKLCLASFAYLLENLVGVRQTVKFTWALSRGRFGTLFAFAVISVLLPSMIVSLISVMGGVMGYVASLIGAFLTVFMLVFGFRFYQVLRQLQVGR